MISIRPFHPADFGDLISWIDSEELLVTIAGTVFTYPLTDQQLRIYLETPNSFSFTITDKDRKIGHAEIVLTGEGIYKIDKLIIGRKENRGKGIGEKVIRLLFAYAFENLQAGLVELNVFDWNIAGIRCYQKCGFVLNEAGTSVFRVKDKTWTALNMVIGRDNWLKSR